MNQPNPPSKYLSYVDGLRTIAVFSVFLYHLSPTMLSGGFVGVDIFFVISGYLITNIIKNGIENGSFRFSQFYIRRIKRLFPAFALVLVLCTIAAYVLLNPIEIKEFALSAMATIGSVSNLYFYFNSGYFAPAAESQALLHTWSLSVEEQFYLVWPLLTFLVITRIPRDLQVNTILIFTLISMGICIWVSYRNPNLSFYLTPFRAAEFSIGGILCWFGKKSFTRFTSETATLIGLCLILYAVFFINADFVFPGWIVFIPCIGTALVIYFSASSSIGQYVIGNKIMAYLGRISYPLYLVHWPLIVFAKEMVDRPLAVNEKTLIFFTALILASLIYQCLELPLKTRIRFWSVNKAITGTFAASAIMFLLFFAQMYHFKGVPGQLSPMADSILASIEAEKRRRFDFNRFVCITSMRPLCEQMSDARLLVLGDSHGPDAINILYPHYRDIDYILQNVGGCPPLAMSDYHKFIKPSRVNYQRCREQTFKLMDPVFFEGIDYLVFSILYNVWYGPAELDNFLSEVNLPKNVQILILGNAPVFTQDLPELILDYDRLEGLENRVAPAINGWTWKFEEQIREIAHKHGAKFIPKIDFFCNTTDKHCRLFYGENKKLLTYDNHHLSLDAAKSFGRFLKENNPTIEKLFEID